MNLKREFGEVQKTLTKNSQVNIQRKTIELLEKQENEQRKLSSR